RFPVFVGVRLDGDPNTPPTRKNSGAAPMKPEKPTSKANAKPISVSPHPVPPGGPPMAATPKRYFEFVDDSSSKFWEIWMDGNDVTTRWGKIGTNGQTKTKTFADEM